MPNDAKLGLFVGIILVVVLAVFFYPNEPATPAVVDQTNSTVKVKTPSVNPSAAAMLPPPAPLSRPARVPTHTAPVTGGAPDAKRI